MRRFLVWTGTAILLAGAVAAAHYLRPFRTGVAQPSPWTAAPHLSGVHVTAGMRVLREFGPWRLTCNINAPAPTPKVGFIQNLGITQEPSIDSPANGCHVGIAMKNREDLHQLIELDLRFGPGNAVLIVTLAYPHFGERGDEVNLRLSGGTVNLGSEMCKPKLCIASIRLVGHDLDNVASTQTIAVVLPAPPHGGPSEVEIPTQGLGPALSALRKITPA